MINRGSGFAHLGLILIIVAAFGGVFLVYFSITRSDSVQINPDNGAIDHQVRESVRWEYDSTSGGWMPIGAPRECPDPLQLPAPIDVDLVSGILYPGQIRGGDYKPHGGFRFDKLQNNEVEVRAIMDGYILKAARYKDNDEIQNFLFYVSDCGLMVMHDHLLELSPRLQTLFDQLPIGEDGDSRTTNIEPRFELKKGELIATKVGYQSSPNIFIDFGLYDLRQTNGVAYGTDFRQIYPSINEYGVHALCWLDLLEGVDADYLRSLPTGNEGKTSDYCR